MRGPNPRQTHDKAAGGAVLQRKRGGWSDLPRNDAIAGRCRSRNASTLGAGILSKRIHASVRRPAAHHPSRWILGTVGELVWQPKTVSGGAVGTREPDALGVRNVKIS